MPKDESKPKEKEGGLKGGKGRRVRDMKVGTEFKSGGKEYRLLALRTNAEVLLLKRDKVSIGEGKMKDITYGISREKMPLDTEVES